MSVDYEKYGKYLEGLDLDEGQKKELINTLYRVCEITLSKKYEPKTISGNLLQGIQPKAG